MSIIMLSPGMLEIHLCMLDTGSEYRSKSLIFWLRNTLSKLLPKKNKSGSGGKCEEKFMNHLFSKEGNYSDILASLMALVMGV